MWLVITIIIIIIISIVYLINKRKLGYKSVITLYTLFVSEWIFILIFGSINPYNYNVVSDKFYFLICLGVTSWLIGFLTAQFTNRKTYLLYSSTANSITQKKKELKINKTIYIVYVLIIFIFTIILSIFVLNYLHQGYSYSQIHAISFGENDEELFSNKFLNVSYNLIMFGIIQAIIPIIVLSFLTNTNIFISIIATILVIIYCMLVGRRIPLLYIVLDLILAIPLLHIKFSQKNKRIIIFSVIILFMGMVLFTAWRKNIFLTGDWDQVYRQFFGYLNLCLQVGDYWVTYIDIYFNKELLFGYSFFKGILNNLHSFFRIFDLDLFYSTLGSELISLPQDNYISIGWQARANAFATMFYFFYLDFRYLGVFAESLIFGFVSGFIELRTYINENMKTIAFYLLLSQAVFKSFIRWEFTIGSYVMSFLYLYLLFSKVKIKFVRQ